MIVEEMGTNNHQWKKHVECEKRRVLSTEFTFWQMGGENGSEVGRNEISKKSGSSPGKK